MQLFEPLPGIFVALCNGFLVVFDCLAGILFELPDAVGVEAPQPVGGLAVSLVRGRREAGDGFGDVGGDNLAEEVEFAYLVDGCLYTVVGRQLVVSDSRFGVRLYPFDTPFEQEPQLERGLMVAQSGGFGEELDLALAVGLQAAPPVVQVVAEAPHGVGVALLDGFLQVVDCHPLVLVGLFGIHVDAAQEVVGPSRLVVFGGAFVIFLGQLDVAGNPQAGLVDESDVNQCTGIFGILFDVLLVVVECQSGPLLGIEHVVVLGQVAVGGRVALLDSQAEHGKPLVDVAGHVVGSAQEHEPATVRTVARPLLRGFCKVVVGLGHVGGYRLAVEVEVAQVVQGLDVSQIGRLGEQVDIPVGLFRLECLAGVEVGLFGKGVYLLLLVGRGLAGLHLVEQLEGTLVAHGGCLAQVFHCLLAVGGGPLAAQVHETYRVEGVGIALVAGLQVIFQRFGEVSFYPLAGIVEVAQLGQGPVVVGLGRFSIPVERLFVVDGEAVFGRVHVAQVAHGVGQVLFGRFGEPVGGSHGVCLDIPAETVGFAHVVLGKGVSGLGRLLYETEALFGFSGNLLLEHKHPKPVEARGDTGVSSPLVPFGGFEYVFLHAVALFVDEAEGEEAGRLVVAGAHLVPFDGLLHVATTAERAVVMVFAHVFLGLGVAVFGGEFHVSDDLGIVLLDKEPLHVHESEGVLGVGVVALGGIGEPVVGLFVVDFDPVAVEVDVAQPVGRLGFAHLSRLQQRGDGLGVPFDIAQVDASLQELVAEAPGHARLSAGLLELQGLLVQLAGLGVGIVLGCHLLDGNAHESLVGNVGMFALGDVGQVGDGFFVSVLLSRLHVELGNGLDGVDISGLGRFLEILFGLLQVGAYHPFGFVVGQTQEVVGVGDLQGFGLAEVIHRLELVHFGTAAVEVEFA